MAQRSSSTVRQTCPVACSLAIAALSLSLLTVSVSPAVASVALGQLAPNPEATACGTAAIDIAQPSVTSGNAYLVPGTGTITSWSHNSRSGVGQTLTLKVFRKLAEPAFYQVVGHDGPRVLEQHTLNGFPANIPVKAGDILGMNIKSPVGTACQFSVPGESYRLRNPSDLADGESEAFSPGFEFRTNLAAVFNPSNSFTLGAIARNKKRGTATITLNVPNPGELTASGKGVTAAGAAAVNVPVTAPGEVKLLIKAKGKKKRRLNDTGKVKLDIVITYTPTNGAPGTQTTTLKLRRMRKKRN